MRLATRFCCLLAIAAVVAFGVDSAVPGDGALDSRSDEGVAAPFRRIPWATSRVKGSPDPPSPYRTQRAFARLQFNQPVGITSAPAWDRLFVFELYGKIYSFANDPNTTEPDLFLDLREVTGDVQGNLMVYGLTFHPNFAENRHVYVCYVRPGDDPHGSRVSRFTVTETEPPRCDPTSEALIIDWLAGGHNGGCIKFGSDGYLYISTGDGTGPSPPDIYDTGQDVSDLLSSILRIDVDHPDAGKEYGIPKDNPFVGLEGARPEVWAYGFRNPWKMSVDPATGDLWVGDVGWELWEMVYRVQRGGNYGWSVTEGPQPVNPGGKRGPTPILPPTAAHPHSESRSVTGGFVYRGSKLPELVGRYIYGDYETGKFWALDHDGKRVTRHEELADSSMRIVAFGEDNAGELYVLDYGDSERPGTIHQLVPNEVELRESAFPRRLSQTGLFDSVAAHRPAAGVVPYSPNAEPWADHAVAERFLALPGDSKIEAPSYRRWRFPEGAVLVKTLSLEMQRANPASRRRVETQLLHFADYTPTAESRTVGFYSYQWNDEQSDATLVEASGLDRSFTILDPTAPGGRREQTWHFASRAECGLCHNRHSGYVLGFDALQLDRSRDYGGVAENQLRMLDRAGFFADALPAPPKKRVSLVDPHDAAASLDERARSYLHANCAHCHRNGGAGNSVFELLRSLDLEQTKTIGRRPRLGTFGMPAGRLVAPGDPYRSVIYYRMAKLGLGRMPQVGSNVVDQKGLDLIRRWIAQLPDSVEGSKSYEESHADTEATLLAKAASPEEIRSATETLSSSTSGALRLLRIVDNGSLPGESRRQIVGLAAAHPNPDVRGLFERFVPESQRIKRLGSAIEPQEILALKGDASRGRQVFFDDSASQCKSCHRVNGTGAEVGPDLTQVAKTYDRPALLEALLEPSRKIAPEYVTYVLLTGSGKVHTGLLAQRTGAEVVLKNAEGESVRIAADEVEELAPQQKSLMPELLLRDMTAQQAADLLEFLCSLN